VYGAELGGVAHWQECKFTGNFKKYLSVKEQIIGGSLARLVAQTALHPLDTMRTRRQVAHTTRPPRASGTPDVQSRAPMTLAASVTWNLTPRVM
jgi:hypothetical protein